MMNSDHSLFDGVKDLYNASVPLRGDPNCVETLSGANENLTVGTAAR
jgi:hypothetical protein